MTQQQQQPRQDRINAPDCEERQDPQIAEQEQARLYYRKQQERKGFNPQQNPDDTNEDHSEQDNESAENN